MTSYSPPVEDITFTLNNIAELPKLAGLEAFSSFDKDHLDPILTESGRLAAELLAPLNRTGDIQGSVLQADGTVKTPEGFAKAYAAYVDSGWGAVPFEPEWGGGGFPWTVSLAIAEMITSANMAFSLCPLLTQGAIHLLSLHGTMEQKAFWLPKLISGEWTGTMNLTEPQAGSDVGALTTRAERQADGSYRIFGQKIFITWGEHDMAENIVHLVLARVSDAPPGTKGISCFIVPKFVPGPDGSVGEKNEVSCLSLEHKLGINASPTCVMEYGGGGQGALAEIIGEENQGMGYMFTMMNNARLAVGLEGVSISEIAYQHALQYAKERLQGRRADAAKGTQSPIIEHPDVRRMLLNMKSLTEAMRCLIYYNAMAMDVGSASADEEERARMNDLSALLTPLSKAWCTDMANEAASLGIQVHGGAGFVEETGAAQYFRDIRIAAIYEGTNGIQALDLVARKLPLQDGKVLEGLLADIESLREELDAAGLSELWPPIGEAVGVVRKSTDWLVGSFGSGDLDGAMAGATPYLRVLASLVAGWLMAKSAVLAKGGDLETSKYQTAKFFCDQILPSAAALGKAVEGGAEVLDYADFRL